MNYRIMCSFKSPVVLITYRKHEALEEILNVISLYEPPKLYIFQDKAESNEDKILTDKVKKIIQNFNFNFPLEYICHNTPLKLNKAIKTALDYCFANEETLIVLEDDIVPNLSFFDFCNHLLVYYKDFNEIGCINGCNLNSSHLDTGYFYSNLCTPLWGWATWKSKWVKNRTDNYYWHNFKQEILEGIEKSNRKYFESVFNGNSRELNVWDLQWNLSLMANQLKTVIPTINLIKNKGFVREGTSINYSNSKFKEMKTGKINLDQLQLDSNTILKFNYELKIIELFTEIVTNLKKDNGKDRILSNKIN